MQRSADVFVVSRVDWHCEMIAHVLSKRHEEVRQVLAKKRHTGESYESVILDKHTIARVKWMLFQEWFHGPEGAVYMDRAWQRAEDTFKKRKAQGIRASISDLYKRNMDSHWKTTVFNRFGGEIWLSTLIGTGRVHAVSVEIVNDIVGEIIREKAGREPVSEWAEPQPTAPTRAAASSQGQLRGVQHTKCEASQLREQAKLADKHWKRHYAEWRRSRVAGRIRNADATDGWYSRESTRLKELADKLWAVASDVSIEFSNMTGMPHKQRDGSTYVPPRPHVSIFERSLNTLQERIDAGLEWPPDQDGPAQ